MARSFLSAKVRKAAKAHAETLYPEESCGLVVSGAYLPCDNLAEDKVNHFLVDSDLILSHLKAHTLESVIHSHPAPHPAAPSLADMTAQLAMEVPFGIVPVGSEGDAGEPFFWGKGVPQLPLLGRPYRHGVTDCYSVIRDWYRTERSIELPDYARGFGWWQAEDHPDLYEQYFQDTGFIEVDPKDARVGDGLLISFGSRGVICHAGVLCEPGLMLHHPGGDQAYDPARLSRRDPASRWQSHIRRVVRYVDSKDD